MYFNNDGKVISSRIKSLNENILREFHHLHYSALANTHTEVQYFRNFFPALQTYINSIRIPGAFFSCRAKEIHASPLVTYGNRQTCELGDYFIIVKYMMRGTLIGKKAIVYQLKRTHNNYWTIDQKQLTLLKDWPTFNFGRTTKGRNLFTLRPTRPEYGSFVLIGDMHHRQFYSDIFGTSYDVFNNQARNRVSIPTEADKFFYSGIISYFQLLTWEIGEPVIPNTDIFDFTSALYRYMDWEDDPPDEFTKYQNKGEERGFWGIEITVGSEGKQI